MSGRRKPLPAGPVIVFGACGLLFLFPFTWGLTGSEATWSVDALSPLTPLAAIYRSFSGGWNNGWFYYKYPLGHCFLLAAAYAPYLLALWWRGEFAHPQPRYPWGFADPEAALFALAVIARIVTLVMAMGCVALAWHGARRLWGRRAAPWAALCLGLSPAMVYYAHTTNLDVPLLFWMLLAWVAAVRAACDRALPLAAARRNAVLFGIASAFALATKEAAYAWLLGCSGILLAAELAAWRRGRRSLAAAFAILGGGALAGALALIALSNGFYNPSGFFHRIQYLTGTLPRELHAALAPRAPYVSGHLLPPLRTWPEIAATVLWTLGPPLLAAALWGVAADLRRAVFLLVPAATHLLAVGPLPDVTVRYLWPTSAALALLGGATMARWAAGPRPAWIAAFLAAAYTVVHGAGVDLLLARDPRLQAEHWLREHAPPGTRIETYHKDTYLPRRVAGVTIERPPFEQITIEAFRQRSPDLVLLCPRDTDRVIGRYDRFQPVMHVRKENVAFLRALREGSLGYRPVARFHVHWPLLPDGFIRGLNPPLLLYGRAR